MSRQRAGPLIILICLSVISVSSFSSWADEYDYYSDYDEHHRMYRGNATTHQEHPYFGVLYKWKHGFFWEFACGGAFITRQVFLTAAHCLHGGGEFKVRYGTHDVWRFSWGTANKFGDGIDHKAQATVFIHPEYKYDLYHGRNSWPDLGLVILQEPIKYTGALLLLPEKDEDVAYTTERRGFTITLRTTFVGMGDTLGDEKALIMKEGDVQMKTCYDPDPTERILNEPFIKYFLCSRGMPLACGGDSGSPIFAHTPRGRVVMALLSASNCQEGEPGYNEYVRVSAGMPWIAKTIFENTECHCIEPILKAWIVEGALNSSHP